MLHIPSGVEVHMKAEPAVALAHLDAALEHIQARARSTGKLELLSSKPARPSCKGVPSASH